jgi:hypothetical protein
MLSSGPCPKFPYLKLDTKFLILDEESVENISINP